MLSVTYTQTALKVEQENVRTNLNSFRDYMQSNCTNSEYCHQRILDDLLHRIKQVHLNCRWRRLEVHVLPEIRSTTGNADLLLAELESLRLLGLDLYRSIRDQLRQAIEGRAISMHDLYRSMELYCRTLHALLAKEEQELFDVALEAIPAEKWFSIAEKFMQQDKEILECGGMGQVALNRHPDAPPSRLPVEGVKFTTSGPARLVSHQPVSAHGDMEDHPSPHPAGRHGKFIAQQACGSHC